MKLKVKRLIPEARIPTRSYKGDAGLDLYSIEDIEVSANTVQEVSTGLAIEIPEGYFGVITARSSMGRRGIRTHFGVIDPQYRGTITVFLKTGSEPYEICRGHRIAQLLILPIPEVEIVETEELSITERGIQGLGSSGK